MKLYRATETPADRDTIPAGSCWTTERGTAEAYTANPGYGGEHIVEVEVDVCEGNVAEARGKNCRDLSAIAALLGVDVWDLKDCGYDSVFSVIENRPDAVEILREGGYDWVRYYDDFPEDADSWARL